METVEDSAIADNSMDYESNSQQTPALQAVSKQSRKKKQKIRTGSVAHSKTARSILNSPGTKMTSAAARPAHQPAPQPQTAAASQEVENMQVPPSPPASPNHLENLVNTLDLGHFGQHDP